MAAHSRGARRKARRTALSELTGHLPADIRARAERLRRARGDLPLREIAALAGELANPATREAAHITMCLLDDRVGVRVSFAREAADAILLPAAGSIASLG